MYDANIVLCIYILKFHFKLEFKEILKIWVCNSVFSIYVILFLVNQTLVYNKLSNET
jgi:hypothetical protein